MENALKIFSVIMVIIVVAAAITMLPEQVDNFVGQESNVSEASYIIYKDGDYTCAKNGTTGRIEIRNQNATTAIQSIINTIDSGKIFITAGEYVIDYPIIPHSNIELSGEPGTVLTSSNDPALIIGNSQYFTGVDYNTSGPYSMAQDAVEGDIKIYLGSSAGLTVGDHVIINSTRKFLGSTGNIGEMHTVTYVAPSYITISEPIYCDYYNKSDSSLVKVQCQYNISVNGITFDGKSPTSLVTGIRMHYVVGLNVRNCMFINTGYTGVDVSSVLDAVVDGCTFQGSHGSGAGYGIAFTNHAQNLRVINCNFYDCNHGFTSGGDYSSVPYGAQLSNCVFNNATVREHPIGMGIDYSGCSFINSPFRKETPGGTVSTNSFISSRVTIGVASTDQGKGDASHTIFVANQMEQSNIALYNSNNVSIINNDLNAKPANSAGIVVPSSSLVVENLVIAGNRISTAYVGIELKNAGSNNIIIDNNYIDAKSTGILSFAGKNVTISNNVVISGGTTACVQISTINTIVDNNRLTSTAYARVLYIMTSYVTVTNNYIYGDNTRNAILSEGAANKYSLGIIISNNFILANVNYYAFDLKYNYGCVISDNYFGSDVQGWVTSTASNRTVINGVGTNGAFDPASAGDWFGHGYEGLFVKWNNGATHYLSVYRGGAWYDMPLA